MAHKLQCGGRKIRRERLVWRIASDILEETGVGCVGEELIGLSLLHECGNRGELFRLHTLVMLAEEVGELAEHSARGERSVIAKEKIVAVPMRLESRSDMDEFFEDFVRGHHLLPNVQGEPRRASGVGSTAWLGRLVHHLRRTGSSIVV